MSGDNPVSNVGAESQSLLQGESHVGHYLAERYWELYDKIEEHYHPGAPHEDHHVKNHLGSLVIEDKKHEK